MVLLRRETEVASGQYEEQLARSRARAEALMPHGDVDRYVLDSATHVNAEWPLRNALLAEFYAKHA